MKTRKHNFRYTIFATHMENLSELATIYPNVKLLHLDVAIKNNRLDFKVVYLIYYGLSLILVSVY